MQQQIPRPFGIIEDSVKEVAVKFDEVFNDLTAEDTEESQDEDEE